MAKFLEFEPYMGKSNYIFMGFIDDDLEAASKYAYHFCDNAVKVFYNSGNLDYATIFNAVRQPNCSGVVLVASAKSVKAQIIIDVVQKALYARKPVLCIHTEEVTEMDKLMKTYLSSARVLPAWQLDEDTAKRKALSAVRSMIAGDFDAKDDDDDDELIINDEGKWKILSDSTVELKKYTGPETDYIIPKTVEDRQVVSIGDRAFTDCDDILSVVIPDGVTVIGEHSFSGCCNMESITIPDSVKNIGYDAFVNCKELCEVTIPSYMAETQRLFSAIFKDCATSMRVTIAKGATVISDSAFKGCGRITSIKIPEGVTSIENGAFSACHRLTSVSIPNGVTTIGDEAFYGCVRMSIVTLPDTVESLGDWCFCDCTGMTSITVPGTITHIGDAAFSNCQNVTVRSTGGPFSYVKRYTGKLNMRYKRIK